MMEDLISRQAAIDAVEESRRLNHHQDGKEACAHEYEHRHFLKILMELPPAEPEIKPISYEDCANAMLMMWMDNVVTDGEYSRIMDKLNKFEAERRTDVDVIT